MTIKNLYPVVEPSLNLDFANSKRLDPRITFTRGSIGTYVGEDGLIKTAAANEARFDHDSDGNSLGLLIEEDRENLQWFDPTSSVLSSSTEDGPTGSSVGVYERSATGETTSVTASTTWTQDNGMSLSFFVKKLGSGRYFKVHTQGQLFGNKKWTYDYDTKTVIENSSAVVSFSVDELPNGWHRVKAVSAAVIRTSGHSLGLSVHDALPTDGTNLSTGLLYGIQLEEGSFPTSYIPTSGSTVTRAADVASITGNSFSSWYNQSEGTMFSESRTSYSNHTIWSMTPSWQNRIQKEVVSVKGTTQANPVSSSGNFDKIALAIATGTCPLYKNGSLYRNYNGGSTETANTFYVGLGDGRYTSGHIARLAYYPQRLPDATLQAMTL